MNRPATAAIPATTLTVCMAAALGVEEAPVLDADVERVEPVPWAGVEVVVPGLEVVEL